MSTYIQLVQDLHRDVGAAGTAPITVAAASGEARRLVNWIRDADLSIQSKYVNWKFLFAQFSQSTTAGVATLAAPADLGEWDLDTFTLLAPGDTIAQNLPAFEYEEVRREILDTTSSQPWRVIVMPDKSLKFEGVPDAAYTIGADYYKPPVALAANNDVSLIPARFHPAIVAEARIRYGTFENAAEQITEGGRLFTDWLLLLENSQLANKGTSRAKMGSTRITVRPE